MHATAPLEWPALILTTKPLDYYNRGMIKQLTATEHHHIRPTWPEAPSDAKRVFARRPSLRKLIVMADEDAIQTENANPISKDRVLISLLANELVELYRYADDGPPDGAPQFKHPKLRQPPKPVYPGWVVAYPFEEKESYWPVTYTNGPDSYGMASIIGNAPFAAYNDEANRVYEAEDAAVRRESDVLALNVAGQALQADIFITNRPYLHSNTRMAEYDGVTVCTPDEAITIISLYLRAQNQFIIDSTGIIHMNFNRGLFYWVGTRELLPTAWRWFSACVQQSNVSGDDKLLTLGGSLLSRVSRALQERDDVHIALNMKPNNDTQDNALGSLDNVLVLLMGAVDASARVAHHVLQLQSRERYAAWQKTDWREEVASTCLELAEEVAPDTRSHHTLTILRLLRNSVHGAAIQGVSFLKDGRQEVLLALPSDDEEALLFAMDALGGRDTWGFHFLYPGRSHVEPAILVDKLFEEVVVMLNQLLGKTPVEQFEHVKITEVNSHPPTDEARRGGIFSELARLSIRWQLGFDNE